MNIKTKYEPYSKTLLDIDGDERNQKSIFVSIVSYRDNYILNTIKSLFLNAKRPENIFVSIVLADITATNKEWVQDLIKFCNNDKNNIKLFVISNIDKNTTFGKLKKMSDAAYNKQDYYLSISSRSEFDPFWDDILIKQYDLLKNFLDKNFIITVEPRKYLPHEDIVKGFVYFTNHKTGVSMQREEYDGAKIPTCGYNEFMNENNINYDGAAFENNSEGYDFLLQGQNIKKSEDYLSKFGLVEFNNRKFLKDEYIAIASGVSLNFIFGEAKNYLKINNSDSSLLDELQFNFYSFINLIRNNNIAISLRFIPIYHLYQDGSSVVPMSYTPGNLYYDEEYLNSDGSFLIKRLIQKYIINNNEFNTFLSIDWQENKFKEKKSFTKNKIIDSINNFIALYNFSTYENSLHWNKKC